MIIEVVKNTSKTHCVSAAEAGTREKMGCHACRRDLWRDRFEDTRGSLEVNENKCPLCKNLLGFCTRFVGFIRKFVWDLYTICREWKTTTAGCWQAAFYLKLLDCLGNCREIVWNKIMIGWFWRKNRHFFQAVFKREYRSRMDLQTGAMSPRCCAT